MNKQSKLLLIIIPLGLVLAGLTVMLCLLDPDFDRDKIFLTTLYALWAFFIVPATLYALNWVKSHQPDFARSFRIGWLYGDLIFLALIITAPVGGILWFVKIFGSLTSDVKNQD